MSEKIIIYREKTFFIRKFLTTLLLLIIQALAHFVQSNLGKILVPLKGILITDQKNLYR